MPAAYLGVGVEEVFDDGGWDVAGDLAVFVDPECVEHGLDDEGAAFGCYVVVEVGGAAAKLERVGQGYRAGVECLAGIA